MTLVALCCAMAVAPLPASAQDGGLGQFTGRYVFDTARSDLIAVRVEEAVKKMNFIKRSIARNRLLRVNRASPVLEFRFHGDTGRLVVPGESPIPLVPGRPAVSWTNADGERFMVKTTLAKGDRPILIVQFDAEDGQRMNLYSLDTTRMLLSLTVTVSSPQLETDLRYRLVYAREKPRPAP